MQMTYMTRCKQYKMDHVCCTIEPKAIKSPTTDPGNKLGIIQSLLPNEGDLKVLAYVCLFQRVLTCLGRALSVTSAESPWALMKM